MEIELVEAPPEGVEADVLAFAVPDPVALSGPVQDPIARSADACAAWSLRASSRASAGA
jgi:hypothetical protein